jgi:uncharacterized protein with GYD domain
MATLFFVTSSQHDADQFNSSALKEPVPLRGWGQKMQRPDEEIERHIMARYISLLRFTEQGAKNLKKSTNRAHTFDKIAAKAGVKIEGQYWTLGAYDGVLILDADSEQKVLRCLSQLASQGNVRSETMQTFIDKEFDEIVGK